MREAKSQTQDEAADEIGTTQYVVSRWELGTLPTRILTEQILKDLGAYLGRNRKDTSELIVNQILRSIQRRGEA